MPPESSPPTSPDKTPRPGLLLAAAALTLVASVAVLELGLMVLSKAGATPYTVPDYRLVGSRRYYADSSPHWGVWHQPGAWEHHVLPCFDVLYTANSHGARDVERPLKSDVPRVAVLGDSFMEGYGVELGERLSERLETASGKPHLNFGTSGVFGTVQQALLYEHLVDAFDHEAVLIGMLPRNDFQDNDPEFGREFYGDRYRPYYEGRYPDYKVRYFVSSPAEAKFYSGDRTPLETFKANVRAFSWTYNALGGVLAQLRYRKAFAAAGGAAAPAKKSKDPRYADYGRYSGYYDYSKEDLLKMRLALERITTLAKAKGRKVYVFTIPIGLDFERYAKDGTPPLVGEMTRMSKEAGFGYVDLLAPLKAKSPETAKLFHACDDHWSPRGHKAAAMALSESLPLYKTR